jgi:Protein of unknown function (DUF2384)
MSGTEKTPRTHKKRATGALQKRKTRRVRYYGAGGFAIRGEATKSKHEAKSGERLVGFSVKRRVKGEPIKSPFVPHPRFAGFFTTAPVQYFEADGRLSVERITADFGMTETQLAETVGLRSQRMLRQILEGKKQNKVVEMVEIVKRVSEWAGGEIQALAWYRGEPLPAFGGRTAESLVKDGKATAVREYLDHIAVGGFV